MRNVWKYLLLIIVSIAAYYSATDYEIVKCDDNRIVEKYDTPVSKNQSYMKEFSQSYLNTTYYRPLVNISFKMDADLYGKDYRKYHRTNLILHALFCSLLFYTLGSFSKKEYLALVVTLLFAVHPIFANAVAWLPGRNDLMLGVFGLLAFIGLLKYVDTKSKVFLVLNAVALLFALLSKETAIVLPALFFAYTYIFNKDAIKQKDNITLYISWVVVALIWFVLRSIAEMGEDANVFSLAIFLSNLRVIPEYLFKFAVPVNLSVLPTYSNIATIGGSLILLLIVAVFYFSPLQNKKTAAYGLLWFMLLILPTTIFQRANAAEWNDYLYCRAYLPLAGLLLTLVALLTKYLANVNKNTILGAGIGATMLLFFLNINYSPAYQNVETFYNNAIAQDSSRAFFYEVIGVHHFKKKEFNDAMKYYELAQKAEPGYYKRSFQVAQAAMYLNDFGKAIEYFQKAIDLEPENTAIIFSMATAYDYSGNINKAIEYYKEGLAIDSTNADAHFSLLFAYQRSGALEKYDDLLNEILNKKHQSDKASQRFSEFAEQAFRSYDIDNANQLWKYSYAFDTTNTYILKKITAAYYMQANADSCRKYYDKYKSKGGKFSSQEMDKFRNLIK